MDPLTQEELNSKADDVKKLLEGEGKSEVIVQPELVAEVPEAITDADSSELEVLAASQHDFSQAAKDELNKRKEVEVKAIKQREAEESRNQQNQMSATEVELKKRLLNDRDNTKALSELLKLRNIHIDGGMA